MRASFLSRLLPAVPALAAAALAVPAAAQAANPWIERTRPLNIAHQGGEDEFPSNTMFAFRQAMKAGADMLELDIGVTKDDKVVVMHDTTLDRTTSGHGTIASHTLRQIRRLDGAYWFSPGDDAYRHDRPRTAYRWRGVATGKRRPPKGFHRSDFRVPTLRQVLHAFPHTPINIEIKGRTTAEALDEYLQNADVLAKLLRHTKRRDLIVVSFKQEAVDRFHERVPQVPVAPGIGGSAAFLLGNASPGDGVVAFQLPITYELNGQTLQITTADNVARAHDAGYAWHTWLSDDGESPAIWRTLIDDCVDGVMTARPKAFERVLRQHARPAACRHS
ncbi:MAG TPA: glycerophosphodiester phosphodiesterase family protein [Baekduia sp.]|nr:glycerophosphodiester phosphodiesterase family protein [Baekduia sp.]